jgi:protein SCO1/2
MNTKIKKWVLLFVLLVLPFIIYTVFFKSATNDFVKLAFIGPKIHHDIAYDSIVDNKIFLPSTSNVSKDMFLNKEEKKVIINNIAENKYIELSEEYLPLDQDTLQFLSHHKIPPFSFINQSKDTITNSDYDGNIYVANFIFTTCPSICKRMTINMRIIQDKLSKYPNIKFLSHTVNPNYDTPEILKQYATKMRIDESNYNFVTGYKEDIYKIAESYFVNASEDELAPGGFLHSEYLVIVDKEGRVRSGIDKNGNVLGVYDGTKDFVIKDLIKDVKVLLAEYHQDKKVTKNVE